MQTILYLCQDEIPTLPPNNKIAISSHSTTSLKGGEIAKIIGYVQPDVLYLKYPTNEKSQIVIDGTAINSNLWTAILSASPEIKMVVLDGIDLGCIPRYIIDFHGEIFHDAVVVTPQDFHTFLKMKKRTI